MYCYFVSFFFSSSDPAKWFVNVHTGPFGLQTIVVYANEPFIIPCRVSNPEIEVGHIEKKKLLLYISQVFFFFCNLDTFEIEMNDFKNNFQ